MKQRFYAVIQVDQECDENMTLQEFIDWVKDKFIGCDYGVVKVMDASTGNYWKSQKDKEADR